MIKRYIPTATAKSIYDIDVSLLKKIGIRYVLADLDNTLDGYLVKLPGEKARSLKAALDSQGMELVIVSNNEGPRVSEYSKALGVRAYCIMWKPFSKRLRKLVATLGARPCECILIGDQVQTDVCAGNGAGVRTILTEPLTEPEPWKTRFNRFFEKFNMRSLKKGNLLKDWRTLDE